MKLSYAAQIFYAFLAACSKKKNPCFVLFKQVDVAVLEVGLGGKYDATNVVCSMLIIIFY
jgi:hypothetical protein